MPRVLLLLGLMVTGCSDNLPGKPRLEDREKRPDEIVDFDALFERNCSGCHGKNGRLGPAPPLNDPLFLALTSEEVLRNVIAFGRKGTLMPAMVTVHGGPLTEKQVGILAKGVRSKWMSSRVHGDKAPPLDGGREKAGNAAAGAKVFARACAGCHGDNGMGGTNGPIADPTLLGLMSPQALRRVVITGRPDLGMPNWSEKEGRGKEFTPLSKEDVADLLALLGAWGGKTR